MREPDSDNIADEQNEQNEQKGKKRNKILRMIMPVRSRQACAKVQHEHVYPGLKA
jgi:hypothetical protein